MSLNETLELTNASVNLEEYLGVRKREPLFVILMSTVYILILICGLVGNISTCFVIVLNKKEMHTTINYYLFSLAVSDLIFLLTGLPIELYELLFERYPWAFGTSICVLRTFIFETTTIASELTILTFTFERWLSVCKVFYAKRLSSSFWRAFKIILVIWVFSMIVSLPYGFTIRVYNLLENENDSKICAIRVEHAVLMDQIILISVVLFFIVPTILISCMYTHMGIKLWRSQKKFKKTFGKKYSTSTLTNKTTTRKDSLLSELTPSSNLRTSCYKNHKESIVYELNNNTRLNKLRKARRDVIKMLFLIVLAYTICWAPFHIQRIWTTLIKTHSEANKVLLEIIYYISGFSLYISSIINPILYNLTAEKYRKAFKDTFKLFFNRLKRIFSCNFTSVYDNDDIIVVYL